jgi:hypothetical protein
LVAEVGVVGHEKHADLIVQLSVLDKLVFDKIADHVLRWSVFGNPHQVDVPVLTGAKAETAVLLKSFIPDVLLDIFAKLDDDLLWLRRRPEMSAAFPRRAIPIVGQ